MFLECILNDDNYKLLLDKYTLEYLNNIDPYRFASIYNLFYYSGFYFIEDLVLKYLDLFNLDEDIVLLGINSLKKKYGKDYVYYIGKDLSILEQSILKEMER